MSYLKRLSSEMKFRYFTPIIVVFLACNPAGKDAPSSGFFENEKSQWITDSRELPQHDSLFYLDRPAPLFRREFTTDRILESASLIVTAAGYYRATINGKPVGKNVLDPAWTAFDKRIYYSEYDVSELLESGGNCIGVSIGNGFYNPLPMRKWGRRNMRVDTKVGKPAFIAKLIIRYQDGTKEEIVSDESWKFAYGPVIKNSVYIGVVYDANRELNGWNLHGFDDEPWEQVVTSENPGGTLEKTFFPPVQIVRQITPVDIQSHGPDQWIVDMGENFTGTFSMNLSGDKGDTVVFRFGERLYEDGSLNPMTTVIGQIKRKDVGGPGSPDIAWQTDSYIFGDESDVTFSPEFTYHTYRFMEISGLSTPPKASDIEGLFMHSNVKSNNNFSSSSDLINSIQEMTERTFLSNLISVQSDCPAREKFGYGGDLNATSESYIYNYDMKAFYRKTVYDWIDAMKDSSFVDTAPFAGIEYCGLSWESAYLITQYQLYLYYNDIDLVKELYAQNNQWMEKVAHIHPDGWVEQGLSDHESLEPVPVALTGTTHYLQCARIMKEFATVMGDTENAEKYDRLAQHLRELVQNRFWDSSVPGPINRQTLFSTLLYHDIVPSDQIPAAKDSLLVAVRNGPSGHFNTGIFGTKYILETLSKYSSPQVVFDIVNSTSYPGWGHMIDRGATTIWETWKESDNTFSNNHPMFGGVTEWFYRWLGGVRPDPDYPGLKEFILNPHTPEGLDYIDCTYHSPYGVIVSNWKKDASSGYRYEWTIPEHATARVALELRSDQSIELRKEGQVLRNDEIAGLSSGRFELTEGSYIVTVSQNKSSDD